MSSSKKCAAKKQPLPKKNLIHAITDSLDQFISKCAVKSSDEWTHQVTFGENIGFYKISDEAYNLFHKLYTTALMRGDELYFFEKQKDTSCIHIRLDFVQNNRTRQYSDVTIRNIIRIYNEAINKYLKTSCEQMMAYVMEIDTPSHRSGKNIDSLVIYYPHLITETITQMLIREEVAKKSEEHNIFKKIDCETSYDEIFNKKSIHYEKWPMYGSRVNQFSQKYKITHIYMPTSLGITDFFNSTLFTEKDIPFVVKLLSSRSYLEGGIKTDYSDEIDPLTIEKEAMLLKEKLIRELREENENIEAIIGKNASFVRYASSEDFEEAKNLVPLLSKTRALDNYQWLLVGKCLHNIDYRLFDAWIEFGKVRGKALNIKESALMWRKMRESNYTLATINFMAEKDNPNKYWEYRRNKIDFYVMEAIPGTQFPVAQLVMEIYKYRFRCADKKSNIWYEYKNHRWNELQDASQLTVLLSTDIVSYFIDKQTVLQKKYADALSNKSNNYEKSMLKAEKKKFNDIISKLEGTTFKNQVIAECAAISMTIDPTFLKKLDENTSLLGFTNGVYDLDAGIFRDGCPDDYISFTTGYNYCELDEDDETVNEVYNFIEKIQPTQEMREYLLMLLSTCLSGSIKEENFYVWTGHGSNGKSKLMELMKYVMGDYYKPMDVRVLTEKRGSASSASPEIADKKGIRIVPFDEPKSTDEINTGFMKIFTGGDMLTARALFKNTVYFKPQFKPYLLCNNLPRIRSDDGGSWRRIKVIPFNSKFWKKDQKNESKLIELLKKNGGKLPKNNYWADLEISEKMVEWKSAFMSILIFYYHKYKQQGLVHPKLVTKYTDEYKKDCDMYHAFFDSYIERTEEPCDPLPITKLHEGMRKWFRSHYYDGKCPMPAEFKSYVRNNFETYDEVKEILSQYRLKLNTDTATTQLGYIK